MYYILKETTNWEYKATNGTYIFAEKFKGRVGKAIGFIHHGTDQVKWFNKGLDIDTKHRTFIEVGKLSKQDTAILLQS
jgi:hypothetical protein